MLLLNAVGRTPLVEETGPLLAFTVGGTDRLSVSDHAVYRGLLPASGSRRALDISTGYLGAFLDLAARGEAWRPPAAGEVRAADMLGR